MTSDDEGCRRLFFCKGFEYEQFCVANRGRQSKTEQVEYRSVSKMDVGLEVKAKGRSSKEREKSGFTCRHCQSGEQERDY